MTTLNDITSTPQFCSEQFTLFRSSLLNAMRHMEMAGMVTFIGEIRDVYLAGYKVSISIERLGNGKSPR